MAVDIGLWRSTRGDTHPHVGVEVDWDYWPQATHLVWEAPALVACVSGGGGGSQQAIFKRDLDPLLAGALERWQTSPANSPEGSLDRWFGEVQASFDALRVPTWAPDRPDRPDREDRDSHGPASHGPDDFSAAGVALLVREDGAAIGNVGVERGWRWRDGRLVQLTTDFTLADHGASQRGQQLPDWFRTAPGASWRRHTEERAAFIRWQVDPIEVAPGDLFVLASGLHDTGLTTSYLAGALERMFEGEVAGAQDVANRLGEAVTRFAAVSRREDRTEWRIHSRTALAIAWMDA